LQTLLSKTKGVPLSTEDLDTGGGDKQPISIGHEYGNVKVPAGVK
jgi:hypothetical protein